MRDELDGRMWAEHHEQLSATIDNALAAAGAGVRRLLAADAPRQALSAFAAFAITALTFSLPTA